MSLDYGEYYRRQLLDGQEFEDFVKISIHKCGIYFNLLTTRKYQQNYGESPSPFEIKLDKKMNKTGNLYIETHEKSDPSNAKYVESGIFRTGITFFIQGDYRCFFVFGVESLRSAYRCTTKHKKTATSMGFLINKGDAVKCGQPFYFPNESNPEWLDEDKEAQQDGPPF